MPAGRAPDHDTVTAEQRGKNTAKAHARETAMRGGRSISVSSTQGSDDGERRKQGAQEAREEGARQRRSRRAGRNRRLRVRMYRVGFGDFFLRQRAGQGGRRYKHILIDCGVHAKDTGSIADSVKQMAQETNIQLALLIMTHRHADHISGFSKGKDDLRQVQGRAHLDVLVREPQGRQAPGAADRASPTWPASCTTRWPRAAPTPTSNISNMVAEHHRRGVGRAPPA